MTIDVSKDIHSLTDFKRQIECARAADEEKREPSRPDVNGKASLVVLDAVTYQRLAELIDRAEAVEGIRRGLEEDAGFEGR
jgi:hypothetical protein